MAPISKNRERRRPERASSLGATTTERIPTRKLNEANRKEKGADAFGPRPAISGVFSQAHAPAETVHLGTRAAALGKNVHLAPALAFESAADVRMAEQHGTIFELVVHPRPEFSTSAAQQLAQLDALPDYERRIGRELLGRTTIEEMRDLPLNERMIDSLSPIVLTSETTIQKRPHFSEAAWKEETIPPGSSLAAWAQRVIKNLNQRKGEALPTTKPSADPLLALEHEQVPLALSLARALHLPESTPFRGRTLSDWEGQLRKYKTLAELGPSSLKQLVQTVDQSRSTARDLALESARQRWAADSSKDFASVLKDSLVEALVSTDRALEESLKRDFPMLGNAPRLLRAEIADFETHREWVRAQAPRAEPIDETSQASASVSLERLTEKQRTVAVPAGAGYYMDFLVTSAELVRSRLSGSENTFSAPTPVDQLGPAYRGPVEEFIAELLDAGGGDRAAKKNEQ
jgi:hypothetical protein